MAIYLARWDCPTCGTQMIEGPKTRCPNCSSPRPEDVQFYLPTDADIVRDEARKREALAGVDWICGHCRAQNKAKDTTCYSCGNPRDGLSSDVDLETKTYDSKDVPRQTQKRREAPDYPAVAKPRKSRAGRTMLIIFVLLAAFFTLTQLPKSIEVEVTGFQWERSLQMEHYQEVADEAWDLPSGAYHVRRQKAIHHYDQVFSHNETYYENVRVRVGEERYVCGKIDMGNGYFKDRYCMRPIYDTRREKRTRPVYDRVPVYRTKYYFDIMRWVERRDHLLRTSGRDHSPVWPQKQYADSENWRKGKRQGRYYVIVRTPDGEAHKEELKEDNWRSLSEGQKLPAKQSLIFGNYFGLAK